MSLSLSLSLLLLLLLLLWPLLSHLVGAGSARDLYLSLVVCF